MLEFIFSKNFLNSTILCTTPILFAALAALISNRAGLLNINIEGSMALSALSGALASHYSNSWFVGLLVAILVGIGMSLILSYCSLKMKTDNILVGIVLNTFASGLCVFILFAKLGVKGDSALAPSQQIPNIGSINLLVYIAFICVYILWFILKKTKLGLRITAVGQNPVAAESLGVKVNRTKTQALVLCGIFCGFGGAYLSMVYLSYFSAGMVAGRGFIGLAAEAMGAGNPWLTMLYSLLFGAFDYFAVGAQSVLDVPYELLNTLPYLMTIIALIIYSVKAQSKNKKQYKKPSKFKIKIINGIKSTKTYKFLAEKNNIIKSKFRAFNNKVKVKYEKSKLYEIIKLSKNNINKFNNKIRLKYEKIKFQITERYIITKENLSKRFTKIFKKNREVK